MPTTAAQAIGAWRHASASARLFSASAACPAPSLTLPPAVIRNNHLVHQGDVSKAFSLRGPDDLRVPTLVCDDYPTIYFFQDSHISRDRRTLKLQHTEHWAAKPYLGGTN